MKSFNGPNEEMEKLSKAIIKAIASSEEVRSIMNHLEERNVPIERSVVVMMLELKAIMSLTEEMGFLQERKKEASRVSSENMVDGRIMTDKEKAFFDYCSDNFDQEDWLKKNGIIIDDE